MCTISWTVRVMLQVSNPCYVVLNILSGWFRPIERKANSFRSSDTNASQVRHCGDHWAQCPYRGSHGHGQSRHGQLHHLDYGQIALVSIIIYSIFTSRAMHLQPCQFASLATAHSPDPHFLTVFIILHAISYYFVT